MIISGTISSPTTLPQSKTCSGAPLVSSCNHLLLQVVLQQVIQEKELSHTNILESSIQQTFSHIAIIFSTGICKRRLVKWQVASGSFKRVYLPKFSQCFQKLLFFQETSSFWFLGNAKIPTDLKPYWSRAGLRHPDLVVKHKLRWHMRRDGMRRADMSWDKMRGDEAWVRSGSAKCEVWSLKCDIWKSAPLSHKARTHWPGWRTARASSTDEKGFIV